jgi:hypothetical protein
MTRKLGSFATEPAYQAAVQRFPQAEFAIRKLMSGSEAFSDMCAELAEAEQALSNVPPGSSHDDRRTEWQLLVNSLVREIEQALRENDPLARGKRL